MLELDVSGRNNGRREDFHLERDDEEGFVTITNESGVDWQFDTQDIIDLMKGVI